MEVIELIVTIIASFVLGGWLTLKFNYHSLFAGTVSKSRMEWINCFREEIAVIIAALETECAKCNSSEAQKQCPKVEECPYRYEAYKARAKLRTRLNMDTSRYGNEYNETVDEVLKSLKFDGTDEKEKNIEVLIELARDILEPEWRRVKKEAQGRQKK